MELLLRLQNDMKTAMKARDQKRLDVIRMLISDVKIIDMAPRPTTAEDAVAAYAGTRLGRQELDDSLRRTALLVDAQLECLQPARAEKRFQRPHDGAGGVLDEI